MQPWQLPLVPSAKRFKPNETTSNRTWIPPNQVHSSNIPSQSSNNSTNAYQHLYNQYQQWYTINPMYAYQHLYNQCNTLSHHLSQFPWRPSIQTTSFKPPQLMPSPHSVGHKQLQQKTAKSHPETLKNVATDNVQKDKEQTKLTNHNRILHITADKAKHFGALTVTFCEIYGTSKGTVHEDGLPFGSSSSDAVSFIGYIEASPILKYLSQAINSQVITVRLYTLSPVGISDDIAYSDLLEHSTSEQRCYVIDCQAKIGIINYLIPPQLCNNTYVIMKDKSINFVELFKLNILNMNRIWMISVIANAKYNAFKRKQNKKQSAKDRQKTTKKQEKNVHTMTLETIHKSEYKDVEHHTDKMAVIGCSAKKVEKQIDRNGDKQDMVRDRTEEKQQANVANMVLETDDVEHKTNATIGCDAIAKNIEKHIDTNHNKGIQLDDSSWDTNGINTELTQNRNVCESQKDEKDCMEPIATEEMEMKIQNDSEVYMDYIVIDILETDLDIPRKQVSEWNYYGIMYWLNRVNDGCFRGLKYRNLRKHICIGRVRGNQLCHLNDVTLNMIGIYDRDAIDSILDAMDELLNDEDFDNVCANMMLTECVPMTYCDAVSFEVMNDPVKIRSNRNIYERVSIEKYVTSYGKDPLTQKHVWINEIVCVPKLKKKIEIWKQNNFIA